MDAKIALITGGSRGLGRSMVQHLARRGVGSIFTYRSRKEEAAAVVAAVEGSGARAVALPLDVGDASTFGAFAADVREALARTFGRDSFDFLVNNAGEGLHRPFAETTEAELDRLYRVHLKAPYLLTQRLLPLIADGGRIVNISSGLARFAMPGASAYASMKGGVEVLTRYLAKELGSRGISVNTVAPGAIETDFNGGRVRDNKQLNQVVASATALGRVGLPDDVGGAVSALLLDEARWINAQRIEVSGGQGI
ncbi:MAG TPA: SDR family oxidoreductase [Anaeromyxobacter sp.]|nr:SDR family oxidoreductase [Anaeromyxobacter sp.]